MLNVPLWGWLAFLAFVVLLLVFDLVVVHRDPHVVGRKEAAIWTSVWIALGCAFGGGVWVLGGQEAGIQYYSAYLLEKSLSVDNLFVFVLLFRNFGVPANLQHRVLFWGILGAIVMRGLFIWAGVAIVSRFSWAFYVFGAILVLSGLKLLFAGDEDEEDPSKSRIVRFLRKLVPTTDTFREGAFFVVENGKKMATPLFLVLLAVELTDVVFATDSVPAVFGVTQDPFLIFSSNVLAILGLRAMYFLLADLMDRFRFLQFGLACILLFIGGKMLLVSYWHVPIWLSLAVIVGVLAGSVVASALFPEAAAAENE